MNVILKEFKKFSSSEQLKITKLLESQIGEETKILSNSNPKSNCFYCNSPNVIKFGTYANKNKPRYHCTSCKKTFSNFTGTAVYNVKKKHLWISFINLTLQNKSIRAIAEQLDLSTTTVFHWRHRLLSSLEKTFTKEFKGIVETDDVFLPFNQKGRRKGKIKIEVKKRGISNQKVAIMVTADRYKTLDMKKIKLGRINVNNLNNTLDKSRLNPDNIICSDMHRTIEAYFKRLNMQHVQLKASAKHYAKGVYHINKVNSLTSEFKRWLNRNFINVSTKYLQNYLNCFMMEQILKDKSSLDELLRYSMVDDKSYERRNNVEAEYQNFLRIT